MKPFLLLLVTFFYIELIAQCTDVGFKNAANFKNDNAAGTYAWTDLSNAQTSNDNYSKAAGILVAANSTVYTNYLMVSNLGFSIPAGATICGISVEVEKSAAGIEVAAFVSDNSIKIVKGGIITGLDHKSGVDWTLLDGNTSYGGNTDLWGTSWTTSDINASDFGVAISAQLTAGVAAVTLTPQIDHIKIKVYYSTPAPLPVKLKSFTAKQVSGKVNLEWVTATELNNKAFVVERSKNNAQWVSIDSIPGGGDTYNDRYYQSSDNSPEQLNFYRLKQVDFNGKAVLSNVMVVKMTSNKSAIVNVITNNGSSLLTIKSNKPIISTRFFNANAIEVFPTAYDRMDMYKTFDIKNLNSGVYFIRVYLVNEVVTKKVMLFK